MPVANVAKPRMSLTNARRANVQARMHFVRMLCEGLRRGFNNEVLTITFGDQSSSMINCVAINHYVINRSDFTEGLIRRIDLKD